MNRAPRPVHLTVVAPVNPLRGYSGLKYLCDELSRRGIQIDLWADVPSRLMHETKDWLYPVHPLTPDRVRDIPKIRAIQPRAQVLSLGLRSNEPMLFVDLSYFPELTLIKRARPNKPIIHYCPELYEPHELGATHQWMLKIYERYAHTPDLIVDVDFKRAQLRKEWYNLPEMPEVILNTLPRGEMPPKSPTGTLAALAGGALPDEKPILIYTGGVGNTQGWTLILQALNIMPRKPFFLAFCHAGQYGTRQIEELRQQFLSILGPEHARICNAVSRQRLLGALHEADAGLVYYPPSYSSGFRYAAPTKLFEYIAAGLPVITSNNPNLADLLKSYGLGVSVTDESSEALANAFSSLLFDQKELTRIRARAKTTFLTELCYEVVSKETIEKIMALLRGNEHL